MRLPLVASDALQFLGWIWPRLIHYGEAVDSEGVRAMTEAIEHLNEWLGAHVEAIEVPDVKPILRADPARWLDEELDFGECIDIALTLCRRASLPQDVITELHDWIESVQVSDCRCVRCTDPDGYQKSKPKTREIIDQHCQRVDLGMTASVASNHASGAKDSDLLSGPWYIYEVRSAIENGKASGALKRRREEEKRKAFHDKIAEAGGVRPRRKR